MYHLCPKVTLFSGDLGDLSPHTGGVSLATLEQMYPLVNHSPHERLLHIRRRDESLDIGLFAAVSDSSTVLNDGLIELAAKPDLSRRVLAAKLPPIPFDLYLPGITDKAFLP